MNPQGQIQYNVEINSSTLGPQLAAMNSMVASSAATSSRSFADSWDSAKSKFVVMTAVMGTAALAIGFNAIKSAGNFESSMNQVQAATSAPQKEMSKLSELAMKFGRDTIFSAGEAADAILALTKGGLTPAQVEAGGLKTTMDLAAASGMSLSEAAIVATSAMSMFGIEAKDATQVADALAGGANASNAEVTDLAQALAQVGPGAKTAGLSLQDTVAVLAAFADKGIKGSDAGTSLKTMLTRLVPTTKEAKEEMERLGISFVNADGSMKDITEVSQILKDKLGGMSEAQKIATLQTIFGSDATRAATVLMDNGEKGIRKYIDATTKQGAASDMANAKMKGWNGTWENFKGSVDTLAISIGQKLIPLIAPLINNLNSLVTFVGANQAVFADFALVMTLLFVPALIRVGVEATIAGAKMMLAWIMALGPIGPLVAAIVGIALLIQDFQGKLDGLAAALVIVGGAIVGYTAYVVISSAAVAIHAAAVAFMSGGYLAAAASLGILQIAQGLATAAQWLLNIAMDANPIGIVIGVVGALAAAMIFLKGRTDESKTAHDNLKTSQDILKESTNRLKDATNNLKDAQDRLTQANMSVEGANLRVERAQSAYTDAIDKYGIGSLEAREAELNLRQSRFDQETALKNVSKASDDVKKKNDDLKDANNKVKDATNDFKNKQKELQDQMDRTSNSAKYQKQQVDFLNDTLHINNGLAAKSVGGKSIGARASGGPVSSNTPYIVGEEGPELFVPKNSGDILPNDSLRSGGGAATTSPTTIVVKVGDETLATKVIDLINNRSTLQGFNAIRV